MPVNNFNISQNLKVFGDAIITGNTIISGSTTIIGNVVFSGTVSSSPSGTTLLSPITISGISASSQTNYLVVDGSGRLSYNTSSGGGGTFTGGTVTGPSIFTNGLTATTISATTYQNLPFSGTVRGSGTVNYIPKWTGTTGLGNSQIQDNGNNRAIGISPTSGIKFWIYTASASTYGIRGDGTSGGVYGQGVGSGYGVYGNANSSIGVVGLSVGDSGTNIGVLGSADINEGGTVTNIGGHFQGVNGTNNYSVHLQDGTEGVNKVLISTTSDGKANWSNVLTGLTNVRSTTISATTYQGNVVTQITAGSGISIDQSTGNVTITATGGGGGTSLGLVYTTGNNLNLI